VGVPGTIIRGTSARRTVTGTNQRTVTTTSAFGAWGRGPSLEREKAGAAWITVQAGVLSPLPGFGPGEPALGETPDKTERQTQTVRSAPW
jgi:hypothetical protein